MASENHPDWYIVLTEPQQEITTVWRMHELGLELYTPIIRVKKSTPRKDVHGRKIVVIRPKPMFPGYAFLRCAGTSIPAIEGVRGVTRIFRDPSTNAPYMLPHEAVMAVWARQHSEHQGFMQSIGGRVSKFKRGDMVRIDEGSVYSGLIAPVEKLDSKGRVQLLLGLMKTWVPQEMVVAA